jgi:hypothetical protein
VYCWENPFRENPHMSKKRHDFGSKPANRFFVPEGHRRVQVFFIGMVVQDKKLNG